MAAEGVSRMTEKVNRDLGDKWPLDDRDFRRMTDALSDPIIAADSQGKITYLNPAVERLLGWSAAELIGEPVTVIQPERFRALHLAGFERFITTGVPKIIGHPVRVPALHRSGEEIDIELALSSARDGEGRQVVVASLRDLRDRVELERQLAVTGYLSATTTAASRLSSMLDFDNVVEVVIATLVNEFGAALARVWLVSPETQTLYLQGEGGQAGSPRQTSSEEIHWEALPLWIEEVARKRGPFVQNGLRDDPRFDQEWVRRAGIEAVTAIPILSGRQLRGVMVLFSCRPIPAELTEILCNFAAIVAASLNDVQLLERERAARDEAEAARRRFAFLADASRVLSESLDYETTLRSIARLAVPELGDWCIVDVLTEKGTRRRLEVAHVDPARVEMAREAERRNVPQQGTSGMVERVLESGRPEVIGAITPEMLEDAAQDESQLRLWRELGLRSIMCVPLSAHGRTRGALTFVAAESGRQYGPPELALAEDLARRAAIAVDNAFLYEELQEAVRIRDEFLSSVSHDLRNPIATIKGRAQVLLRRLDGIPLEERERLTASLQAIEANAGKMNRLINDLVDVARLRIGEPLELSRQRFDLVALARHIAAEHQEETERHAIRVVTDQPEVSGSWDVMRLERVLTNLLGNAVKYSPEGGEIVVEVRSDGPEAVVTVRDPGLGIPAADIEHVFERYHRGSNVAGTITGTGVGLAGARQIVDQHGGTITVESKEGEGSTFTVRLPLEASSVLQGAETV